MKALRDRRVQIPAGVAGLLLVAAVVAAVLGAAGALVAVMVAAGLVAVGVAAGAAAKVLAPGEPDVEDRVHKGPGLRRRQLMLGAGAGVAAVVAAAFGIPAARRANDATERLERTEWRPGSRVVDPDGNEVLVAEVREGELLTVYPHDAVGSPRAQAVLIREPISRYQPDPERDDWTPDGIAVYSKLCTHMACPVGLYHQQSGTILCPCHQAVFDLLDSGRAVHGPARRALPQLPVEVTDDGRLVARGDFSDAVGTGFWGRP